MKQPLGIALISFLCAFECDAQTFDCTAYSASYCEALNTDTLPLPNYTAAYYSEAGVVDSLITSIPDCIDNLDAFCSGVQQALAASRLSIRQIGNPRHVSECSFTSFENHGVLLTMTGDLVIDGSIFDENKGFNFVMKQRIIDSLGVHVYMKLGRKDPRWIEFDQQHINSLLGTIVTEFKTDTTIFLKVDEALLAKTDFRNLEGVEFKDELGKASYSYQDVLSGIEIRTKGDQSRTALLTLDPKNYTNPNYCKSRYNWNLTLPIKIPPIRR